MSFDHPTSTREHQNTAAAAAAATAPVRIPPLPGREKKEKGRFTLRLEPPQAILLIAVFVYYGRF